MNDEDLICIAKLELFFINTIVLFEELAALFTTNAITCTTTNLEKP
jgi:hypothetical protein